MNTNLSKRVSSILPHFKKALGNVVASITRWVFVGIYVFWKSPLWVKTASFLVFVTLLAIICSDFNIFSVDRATLIGVLTLQTAFAVYLVSVSKEDNVKRLIPAAERILVDASLGKTDVEDFLNSTSYVTFALPQRLSVYVLVLDIATSPLLMLRYDFMVIWISTMVVPCMFLLVLSILLLRIELFEFWIRRQVRRLQNFLDSHGKEFIVGLILLLVSI